MIRGFLSSIIAVTTLMFWSVVFALSEYVPPTTVMHLPKLEQYVTDFAWVLDENTLSELNANAYKYEQASGHQFVTVLIPDRQWYELFDISLKIFNDNQIGNEDINDWLLLVIVTDEKKIRIMVGYGLEGEMPDVLASKIIEEDIRPLVNSGDFAWAVRAFYARAEQAIAAWEAKQIQPENELGKDEWMIFAVALFAYFFGRTFRTWRKNKNKKSSWISSGIFSWLILGAAIITTLSIIPVVVYIVAGLFGYIAGASFMFFPGWPWWGFWGWSKGGRWGGSRGGWGGSFGWFSWGGGSSWGGWAGD